MTLRDFKPDFNKNFNKIADLVGDVVTDVVEQVQSPRTKQILNSALDVLKPHFQSLGLRVARLGTHEVEVVIPKKNRNLDEDGDFLTGVLMSTAVEAYRLLWKRNAPPGDFKVEILEVNFKSHKKPKGEVRVRWDLSELARESRWVELQRNKKTNQEAQLNFFDEDDQICAEVQIKGELRLQEMLEWK